MKIEFSPTIENDLEEIASYIARDNPRRAETFALEIYEEFIAIGKYPLHYRFRPEIGPDARLARVGRYVILFAVEGDTVRIERVIHGARELPVVLH